MSIAQAEVLKRDLTDKYVVVKKGVAELRRFDGLTGQVKTVNMNGQVLVQFDGPVDISWYDIHPNYLQIVDAPQPKAKAEAKAEKAPAAEKAAPKPAAAAGEKKLSPLEQARLQGAGGAAKPGAPAAKKPSPLDLARAQGAPKAAPAAAAPSVDEAPVAAPAAAAPKAAASKPALTRPGSTAEIIALARQQGAVKS